MSCVGIRTVIRFTGEKEREKERGGIEKVRVRDSERES